MPRQMPDPENPENQSGNTGTNKADDSDSAQRKSVETTLQGEGLSALWKSHRELKDLLDTIQKRVPERQKDNIQKLSDGWFQHSRLEEEILLPELEKRNLMNADLLEGEVKRDLVKLLLVNLQADQTHTAENAAKLRVLDAFIRQLIEAEEKPETGLFARIESFKIPNIGTKIATLKKQLEQSEQTDPVLCHLSLQNFISNSNDTEDTMINRERDSQGRFVSDNQRRYGSQSDRNGDYGRNDGRYGRYDSDQQRGGDGRYSSGRDYDDNRGYGRSRDDDSNRYGRRDEGYRRDQGQGGWFGDSEGHSEASRRGWEGRRSYGQGQDFDDDRGRYAYGRSHDESSGSGRYGREDQGYGRDHGQGGWFGDSEGHSEASRRGWEGRRSYGGSQDDDRGNYGSSRSRDDEYNRGRQNDDSYGRGRGRGYNG